MRNFMKLALFLMSAVAAQAQAQQKLTCMYRAPVSGSTGDVVMEFTQDSYGNPLFGRIRVQDAQGRETVIPIKRNAIAQFNMTGPGYGSELIANVHVRSYDVDLVLNYMGNEFWIDAASWFNTESLTLPDLQEAYQEMLESGAIEHRMQGPLSPVVQMTGSVRMNGQVRKFASSQFVCSAVLY